MRVNRDSPNDSFMIFEVDDSGERKRLNIHEEQFRENYEKKILDPKKVLVIVKENLRKIYIWKGKDSLVRKRFISSQIAQTLQKELIMDGYDKCNIVSMDQGNGTFTGYGDIPLNPIPPNSPGARNAEQKVGRLIMFCENCGMALQDPHQTFCPNCGTPLRKTIDSGKCYIMLSVGMKKIYLWKGLRSSVRSGFIASKRAIEIRDKLGGDYSIITIREAQEDHEFLKLFKKALSGNR